MEEQLLLFHDEDKIICGIDEAGRGPLAGPVVAAACILNPNFPTHILNDSKKLSHKKLLELEKIIKAESIYAISFIDNNIIDEINILNASLLAMKNAFLELYNKTQINLVLIDGNKVFKENRVKLEAIVKGDSKIHEIMAASILAKTARDREMEELDKQYPEYNLKKHKGYPTKEHRELIKIHGFSPIHRKTFTVK